MNSSFLVNGHANMMCFTVSSNSCSSLPLLCVSVCNIFVARYFVHKACFVLLLFHFQVGFQISQRLSNELVFFSKQLPMLVTYNSSIICISRLNIFNISKHNLEVLNVTFVAVVYLTAPVLP
jgi:hypothetical protein